MDLPRNLYESLQQWDQLHLVEDWRHLPLSERSALQSQLEKLDLQLVRQLFENSKQSRIQLDPASISAVPAKSANWEFSAAGRLGAEALSRGEVAVLLVAGGQGTRLRCDQPKGMFEIGPVSNATLFQIHAEKVLARIRRHGGRIPFLIMTSPATDAETRSFFAENQCFGLPVDDVFFFCQGTMPAVDAVTGRILRDGPARLALSPNGHGGTLAALRDSNLLGELRRRGVRFVFYLQVDNPLTKIADPVFLGQHILARSEASSKVVPKLSPDDKVGNFVLLDARCSMIEYIDLPRELAEARDADGQLRIRAANPAIHIFDVEFLQRLAADETALPYHIARKCVKHWTGGKIAEPKSENALKFEKFIFDTLPLAERWLIVETTHRDEFAPLKNLEGPDSPEQVRAAMHGLACDWLEQAGVSVCRRDDWPQEISPLLALDAEELARRVDRNMVINGPRYWSRDK